MKVENRKARFDYEVVDKLEAGISLSGSEVKSVKEGRIQLEGAHVVIRPSAVSANPEAWLVNANIPAYKFARNETEPTRSRKLLLHKKEIVALGQKMKEGRLAVVPLEVYTTGRLIKLSIGLVKGRKAWQKRDLLKKRDLKREEDRELRD